MPRSVSWWLMLVAGLTLAPAAGVFAQEGEPPALLPAAPEPSPLLAEPETPEQMFDAAVLLVDLARFDLAKVYLEQFVQSAPADDVLLALRGKHGTATFLKLSRIPELHPTAMPLLKRLTELSRAQAEDPAYVDGLLSKLLGTPTERELATSELRNAGPRAVPQLFRRIAAAGSTVERDLFVLTLGRLGQAVVPVLIAGLDSPVEAIQLACIQTLERLQSQAAVPLLWPLAYSESVGPGTQLAAKRAIASIRFGSPDRLDRLSTVTAVGELTDRARRLLSGAETLAIEGADEVEAWRWTASENTVSVEMLRPQVANLQRATRHARDALVLSPTRPEHQQLYLLAVLAGEVQGAGWATLDPAQSAVLSSAMSMGAEPLLAVLREAMALGRTDAAWGAVQALSGLSSPAVLQSRSGKPSPVLGALNYPDPRVQFGAAVAVLRSKPTRSIPQAGRVVDVLRRALTDPGQARALVIDADSERATTVAGYLAEQGYDPLTASTGKQGFTQAAELSGVDLVVLHANCQQWALSQTVANFRADVRTEFIPLVIYGPEETRQSLARLVARTPRTVFAAESPAAQSFWYQVTPFLQRFDTPPVTAQQRGQFRDLAAYWLATVATSAQGAYFDTTAAAPELLALVGDEVVSHEALMVLGTVPSAEVQSRLVDYVLGDRWPTETRVRAAQVLASHIPRFGLLLEQGTVARLTTAWEATDDPALKGALASVIGALRPNEGLVGERLLRLSLAPAAH
uniref:Response regulatory domain-containing protein n=1 Tax=Schlesneria paludicola TaxID=360056 RepID=A0A7C2K0I7_9PLAN